MPSHVSKLAATLALCILALPALAEDTKSKFQ